MRWSYCLSLHLNTKCLPGSSHTSLFRIQHVSYSGTSSCGWRNKTVKLNYKQIRIKLSNKKLQIKASIFVYMQRKNAILLLFSKKKKKKKCLYMCGQGQTLLSVYHSFLSSLWLSNCISLSLCLSLHSHCVIGPDDCWASCWGACPDMNWAAKLTHPERER